MFYTFVTWYRPGEALPPNLKLHAACRANRHRNKGTGATNDIGTRGWSPDARRQGNVCVAAAAASVLHLMAVRAEPPYNVTLAHLAGVPLAMSAVIEQISLVR